MFYKNLPLLAQSEGARAKIADSMTQIMVDITHRHPDKPTIPPFFHRKMFNDWGLLGDNLAHRWQVFYKGDESVPKKDWWTQITDIWNEHGTTKALGKVWSDLSGATTGFFKTIGDKWWTNKDKGITILPPIAGNDIRVPPTPPGSLAASVAESENGDILDGTVISYGSGRQPFLIHGQLPNHESNPISCADWNRGLQWKNVKENPNVDLGVEDMLMDIYSKGMAFTLTRSKYEVVGRYVQLFSSGIHTLLPIAVNLAMPMGIRDAFDRCLWPGTDMGTEYNNAQMKWMLQESGRHTRRILKENVNRMFMAKEVAKDGKNHTQ